MIEENELLNGQILSEDNTDSLIFGDDVLEGKLIASGSVIASMVSQKGAKGDKGDKGDTGATGADGQPGADGYSPSASVSKVGKVATITITDKNGTTTTEIRDGEDGSGTGDMLKSTYDTDNNGIVDNAEKVNNHTVLSDVPADAVFTDTTYTAGTNVSISAENVISATDTTYTAGTGIDITAGVISNTQTSAEWGNISGTLTDQTDLNTALGNKIDKSNTTGLVKNDGTIDTTAYSTFSGSYNDLSNKPTIPTKISDLTNDSNFEVTTNKVTSINSSSTNTQYPSAKCVYDELGDKQDILVSGTSIKTINNNSILGSGNLDVGASIPVQDTAPLNPSEDDLWIDTSEPEEMQETIQNAYSDSTTDTYSCDYINDKLGGLLDIFYPVGSYYETSDTSFNPNTAWGGTWVEDSKGRFLLANGVPEANTDNYFGSMSGRSWNAATGSKGGQDYASNPLSSSGWSQIQLRSTNQIQYNETAVGASNYWTANYKINGSSAGASTETGYYGAALGGKTDLGNNMPPYVSVKRWHRTA